MDQASDYTLPKRDPFELNITEEPPTAEQVQTILEYVGKDNISQIIKGAHDQKDALRKFKESKENFVRPVVSVVRPMRQHSCPSLPDWWLTRCYRRWTGTTARPLPAPTTRRFSSSSMRQSDSLHADLDGVKSHLYIYPSLCFALSLKICGGDNFGYDMTLNCYIFSRLSL